jgi:hypothetical protein
MAGPDVICCKEFNLWSEFYGYFWLIGLLHFFKGGFGFWKLNDETI